MRKFLKKPAIILLLIFIPLASQAAPLNYFEFSPDINNSVKMSSTQFLAQSFTPYDDFVSGFDIFYENQGNSGSMSVSLLNDEGEVLSSKTASVPATGKTWSGQKLHVDLNSAVFVSPNRPYKIRLSSSLPNLKIFYTDLVQLRQHNSNYFVDKSVGPAFLGDAQQNFAFKFALYENNDDRDPELSNVIPLVDSPVKARINFNTNEPVDYKVEFGFSQEAYNNVIPFQNIFIRCHEEIRTCFSELNVLENKSYDFKLTARDPWGNEASATGTFSTAAGWSYSAPTSTPPIPSDTTAPQIFNPRATSITDKSATIAWNTDEAANSSVLLRYDRPGAQALTSVGDATYELEHAITLGGFLEPKTKYIAFISSIDSANNAGNAQVLFETLETPPSAPNPNPQPATSTQLATLSTAVIENNAGDASLLVSWSRETGELPKDGYRIDVFDRENNLANQLYVPKNSTNAELNGMNSGEYNIIVYKNNGGVFEKAAKPGAISVVSRNKSKFYESNFFYLAILGGILILVFGLAVILRLRKPKIIS